MICPRLTVNETGERYQGQSLVKYLEKAEIAVIGTEKLDRSVIEALPDLKFVAKYGVGMDNIDTKALNDLGIGFGWQGGVNRRSVSEMTLCFLIGLFRNLFFTSFKLKDGEWDKRGGQQLSGRTIGIIGCGFVGSDVVSLLKPFGCEVLINDIVDKGDWINSQCAAGVNIRSVSKDELVAKSDAISLHVPLDDGTNKLVDAKFLSAMSQDAFLINTSRGGVVDQEALKLALIDNSIAGAAIDVYDEEPPVDLEFLQLPNLMLTPHIGGNAQEAVLAMGRSAIDGVEKYLQKRAC